VPPGHAGLVRSMLALQRTEPWSLRLARAVPVPVRRLAGLDTRRAPTAAAETGAAERELCALGPARTDAAVPRIVQVRARSAPRRSWGVCVAARARRTGRDCGPLQETGTDGTGTARRSLASARRFEPYQL
jgi:hypothetical protein